MAVAGWGLADVIASGVPEALRVSLGCGNPPAVASIEPGEIVLDLGSGGGLDVLLYVRGPAQARGQRA